MRKLIILLTGIGVLAMANYSIYQKEQLLAHGRTVFWNWRLWIRGR